MAKQIKRTRRLTWACGLILGLPSCHPTVSLGGDGDARIGAQGGGHANAAGQASQGGARLDPTGGRSSITGGTATQTAGGNSSVSSNAPATGSGGGPSTGAASLAGGAESSDTTESTGGAMVQATGGSSGTNIVGGGGTLGSPGGSPNLGGAAATAGTSPHTSAGGVAGTTGASSSVDCLNLTEVECRIEAGCTAVEGPFARKPDCAPDARGFSSCITGGCRAAGTRCNTLDQLDQACSATCPSRNWAIAADSGCPTCVCVDDIKLPNPGKGWDIVAWQEADGWHYSLIYGTNRTKGCDEVKIHESDIAAGTVYTLALPNLVAVKAALTRIAAGGKSSWVSLCDGGCSDIDCRLDDIPDNIAQDIKLFAAALGVNLNG